MKQRVELSGQDFKQLVTEVTRFPGTGAFAGSDLVNLSCSGGGFKATAFGVVLAVSRKKNEGYLNLVGVDNRVLQNFAGIVSDASPVLISANSKTLTFRSRKNTITSDLIAGTEYDLPEMPATQFKIKAGDAERIRYLSEIAFNDITKAELCCVMLAAGKATAMDQKCCAVLTTSVKVDGRVPLPLVLGRAISAGNRLYVDDKVSVLRSGCTVYSVPSMTKALTDYPFKTVRQLRSASGNRIAEVKGPKLAGIIDDCLRTLGQLARTETLAEVHIGGSELRIASVAGTVRFDARPIPISHSEDRVFRVPLASLGRVRPFLTGVVILAGGAGQDLYLHFDPEGWAMFPGEVE